MLVASVNIIYYISVCMACEVIEKQDMIWFRKNARQSVTHILVLGVVAYRIFP
jgi:hypothetical protein